MKSRYRLLPFHIVLVGSTVSLLISQSTTAAPKYYDTNDTTPGLGGGAGAWDLSTTIWNPATAGTAATVAFVNGDDAFFQTAVANSVTLDANLTANSITQTTNTTATTIGIGAGSQITLTTGNLTNSGNQPFIISPNIALSAAGTINASNVITLNGVLSGSGFTKTGNSTLNLSAANTYTGPTTVSAGIVSVGGAVGASIIPTSAISVIGGTALVLDYTVAGDAGTNKIADAATVTISRVGSPFSSTSSGLTVLGNSAADTDETVGTLALGAGASVIGVTQANSGRIATLTSTNGLSRSNLGTALVRGSSLGSQATQVGMVKLGSLTGLVQVGTSTTSGGSTSLKDVTIIPYLLGDTSSSGIGSANSGAFVTYDTTRGLRPLNANEQNALTLTTETFDNTNVAYNASGTLTLDATNRTWNSLQIGRSGTFATRALQGSGGSLAITSGALQTGNQSASTTTTLDGFSQITFGNNVIGANAANEGIIQVASSSGGAAAPLTIGSPIQVTQSGGLTKTGAGTLTLTAANLFSGPTTINLGTLQIGGGGTTGNLGSTSSVTVNGGTLAFNRSDTQNFTTPINGAGNGTVSRVVGSGQLTLGVVTGIANLSDSTTAGGISPTTVNQSGSGLTFGTVSGAAGSVVNFAGDSTGITTITNALSTGGQTVRVTAGTVNLGSSRNTATNLEVAGGILNTTGTNRLSMGNNDAQTLVVSSGTLNVLSTADFGLRLGADNGPAAGGGFGFTGTLSGGTINALGANGVGLGSTTASKIASFSQSGGDFNIGSSTLARNLVLGADTAGTSTTTYNLGGGKLLVSGAISGSQGAGAKQAFVFTGGTLAVGTYTATNLTSTAGTAVSGSTNTLTNAGGILAPGDVGSSGRTTVTGNYTVTSGSLAIEVGGTTSSTAFQDPASSGTHDRLTVTGDVALAGNLNVSLIDGFVPANATTFIIVSGSSVTGTFTNLNSGRVSVGGFGASFLVTVGATTVTLSDFQAGVGGDYAAFIAGFNVGGQTAPTDDFDNDNLDNVVENILGSNPSVSNTGLTQISATAGSVKFRHNQSNTIASDVAKTYQFSTDLIEWKASGQITTGGTTATITAITVTDNVAPANDVIEVTVTVTGGPSSKVFGRLVGTKAP